MALTNHRWRTQKNIAETGTPPTACHPPDREQGAAAQADQHKISASAFLHPVARVADCRAGTERPI